MAWNEPGNKEKDPWGGNNSQQTPPELDEIIKKFKLKLMKLFGFKPNKASTQGSSNHFASIGIVVLIGLAIWAALGIFIVNPAERAVILRFGQYRETVDPGIHWIPRFIDKAYVVNEQKIGNYSYQAQMLTIDENIVSVAVAVQYRVSSAKDYLFNAVSPEQSLKQATASALRQVVGQTTLDDILTKGRDQVRYEVEERLKQILLRYKTGLHIVTVAMQPARAPDDVKDAFDDAIKAREDEQRFVNQAQAYAMQVEPIAKGQAQRVAQEASAYKEQVVLRAQGDTARFLALLPEFTKAPEVTKQRLYLDVMERLLNNTSKVFVDTKGGNNVFYLPLDKLFKPVFDDRALKQESVEQESPLEIASQSSASSETPVNEQLNRYGYERSSYFSRRVQNEND